MTPSPYPRCTEDDLARALAEAGPFLEGGRVRRVRARGQGFACEVRARPAAEGPRETLVLVAALASPGPFLAIVPRSAWAGGRGEPVRGFSERLRALLEGARVAGWEVVPGDRVVRFDFERGPAAPATGEACALGGGEDEAEGKGAEGQGAEGDAEGDAARDRDPPRLGPADPAAGAETDSDPDAGAEAGPDPDPDAGADPDSGAACQAERGRAAAAPFEIALPEGPRLSLWLALTGTTADAVVVDREGRAIASWRRMQGLRGAPDPGALYAPRPRRRSAGPTRAPLDGSPTGVGEAVDGAPDRAVEPALDHVPDPPPGSTLDPGALPFNRALLARFEAAERRFAREETARAARAEVARRERRARGAVAELERAVAEGAGADLAQQAGDLLLASFHRLRPGLAEVEVPDYYAPLDASGEPPLRRIGLDPARPVDAQAERWFRRARKARRGAEVAAARLAEKRAELERLAASAAALERGDDPTPIAAALGLRVPGEAGVGRAGVRGGPAAGGSARAAPGARRPASGAPGGPSAPRRFRTAEGFLVLVGRTSAGNDALTFRQSASDDLFFHVSGFPGSHVILRTGGRDAPPGSVLDAALLALHYSKARGAAGADVSYAERKHVRKPRGAPPGRVLVERAKAIYVRAEPERLARLLATGGGGADDAHA